MFASPWALILLGIVPLCGWRLYKKGHATTVLFSSSTLADGLPRTLRQRLLWLPNALTLIALTLLIISIARPRQGRELSVTSEEGASIQMVVDRSSSMQAMDFKINGQSVDRLTAIKNVAANFVEGDGEALQGRASDLIGLITFAGFADTEATLTLDHEFVVGKLFDTSIVNTRAEDGTAIGDALALAVEKLQALSGRDGQPIPSKVIILLTDGENTAGDIEPIEAAELAQTLGFKVYTIGVGTKGLAPVPFRDPFSGRTGTEMMQVNIDENTLRRIASLTGGQYFRATDTESLEGIYKEIDALEKVEIETRQYTDFREWAVQSIRTPLGTMPPLLLLAFSCFGLRIVLETTWLRQL